MTTPSPPFQHRPATVAPPDQQAPASVIGCYVTRLRTFARGLRTGVREFMVGVRRDTPADVLAATCACALVLVLMGTALLAPGCATKRKGLAREGPHAKAPKLPRSHPETTLKP